MKKIIVFLMLFGISLNSPMLHADEKSVPALSFWDKLRMKLEQVVPQKKLEATTAVGGVRGSKMAADDVYWKDESIAKSVDVDELETFKAAMSLASSGEMLKAKTAFAEFIAKNPDSNLRKEAEEALLQLQASN